MTQIRKSKDRGYFDFGWLKTHHTFSFSDYYDPNHMHFRSLRVINEDVVAKGKGFGTHPHRDMEIVTFVISGAIEHKDSMGNTAVIRPGEIQRMSAGTGITHSEFNPKQDEDLHLLQIWIMPDQKGITPGYEQKKYVQEEAEKGFTRIVRAAKQGEDAASEPGCVLVHQDAEIYLANWKAKNQSQLSFDQERYVWVQMVQGELEVQGARLEQGDGLALGPVRNVPFSTSSGASMLVFVLG